MFLVDGKYLSFTLREEELMRLALPSSSSFRWKMTALRECMALKIKSCHNLSQSEVKSKPIGHFRITFGLFFTASLGAHLFIWKLVFICMWMKANFHMKRWAPGLALKKRPKVIRKWPICDNLFCSPFTIPCIYFLCFLIGSLHLQLIIVVIYSILSSTTCDKTVLDWHEHHYMIQWHTHYRCFPNRLFYNWLALKCMTIRVSVFNG